MSNYSGIEEKQDSAEQVAKLLGVPSIFKVTAAEWNTIRTKLNDLKQLIELIDTFSGAYADLSGKPDLSIYGEKGGYNGTLKDLENLYNNKLWSYYVLNWSVSPVFNKSITGGDVYDYTLDGNTRFRFIPSTYNPNEDAFYDIFDGTNLSNLIIRRG